MRILYGFFVVYIKLLVSQVTIYWEDYLSLFPMIFKPISTQTSILCKNIIQNYSWKRNGFNYTFYLGTSHFKGGEGYFWSIMKSGGRKREWLYQAWHHNWRKIVGVWSMTKERGSGNIFFFLKVCRYYFWTVHCGNVSRRKK